ncbi:hypothetical protein FB45DRAFT_870450 [Roridomyces roridus]|uniref:Uncharacterized protein n=1 Tax=Roridomyces roridus TaxID=1738132 RepID=A0AAD7BJ48_9AGAR|nr:hypothetical protein FB45DRAFT_870450 [Roridomyces roridus]
MPPITAQLSRICTTTSMTLSHGRARPHCQDFVIAKSWAANGMKKLGLSFRMASATVPLGSSSGMSSPFLLILCSFSSLAISSTDTVFCYLVNRHRVLRNPLECCHRIRVHPSLLTTVDLLPRVVDPISLITAATRGTVAHHWPFEWILALNLDFSDTLISNTEQLRTPGAFRTLPYIWFDWGHGRLGYEHGIGTNVLGPPLATRGSLLPAKHAGDSGPAGNDEAGSQSIRSRN